MTNKKVVEEKEKPALVNGTKVWIPATITNVLQDGHMTCAIEGELKGHGVVTVRVCTDQVLTADQVVQAVEDEEIGGDGGDKPPHP